MMNLVLVLLVMALLLLVTHRAMDTKWWCRRQRGTDMQMLWPTVQLRPRRPTRTAWILRHRISSWKRPITGVWMKSTMQRIPRYGQGLCGI